MIHISCFWSHRKILFLAEVIAGQKSELMCYCIFTNRVETIINQFGVVVNCGTAHSQIFSTLKLNYDLKPIQKEKITQYYNFLNKNTDCFVRKLEENYESLVCSDPSNPPNFSNFLTSIVQGIPRCDMQTCSTKENSKEFNQQSMDN